jgi:hypothetical protein
VFPFLADIESSRSRTRRTHCTKYVRTRIAASRRSISVVSEGSGRISVTPSFGSVDGGSQSASLPGDSNGRIDVAMKNMSSINAGAFDVATPTRVSTCLCRCVLVSDELCRRMLTWGRV